MVRLAQDFSMRYPLVDGQGNFGSVDGDNPAAMRYTEARMAKIAQELLADINKETVPFVDNFDGSLQEPAVLPTRIPNLLLMGSEGIAVGMATKIPPHNLTEVSNAIIAMIKEGKSEVEKPVLTAEQLKKAQAASAKAKKAKIGSQEIADNEAIDAVLAAKPEELTGEFNSEIEFDTLMTHIQGPDFPTAGIMYDFKAIQEAYRTGKGRIVVRAKASIEEDGKSGYKIVVTELPYQVNKARMLMKIADLVKNKKVEGIKNLRDESDRTGMRVVIELSRTARPKVVLNKLFKYSDLQSTFSANMVALNSDGTPQLMNLRQILREYVVHRQTVVVKRSQYELNEARNRAHILEGLLIALQNLDDVIETIKKSQDTEAAREALMKKFKLSEIQATAILDMQLKRLAALERKKIEDEYQAIKEQMDALLKLLTSTQDILDLIITETEEMIETYGDERLTKLVKGKVGEFSEEDLVANEAAVVTLTESGYVKRMNPGALRSQSRGGKGAAGLKMKEEDVLQAVISCNTHDTLMIFTNQGRVFRMKAFEIPEASRQAKGTAIVNLLSMQPEENVRSVLIVDQEEENKDHFITLATRNGLVKKTAVKLYENIRQNGIVAITLNDGDELVWGRVTSGKDHLMLITHDGKSIRFSEEEVKASQRDTKGVKGITLKKDDFVVGVEAFPNDKDHLAKTSLLIVTENGMGKRTTLDQYPVQKRSGLGVKVSEITKKTGKVASARVLEEAHKEVVISTKDGQTIKLPISKKSIPTLTRPTQGVILMKLAKDNAVVAVALTSELEEEEEKKS